MGWGLEWPWADPLSDDTEIGSFAPVTIVISPFYLSKRKESMQVAQPMGWIGSSQSEAAVPSVRSYLVMS